MSKLWLPPSPEDRLEGFRALHGFKVYEGDIVYGEDGSGELRILNDLVFEQEPLENLIVTSGKNLLLDRLFALSGPPTAITSVGVGTDSTAAAAGQTQLNPSVAGSVLIQTADAGTARASQTVTIASTFGTGVANFSWNEGGLFNGNTNGTSTMFNRIVFGPFSKTSSVSIIYQVQITQA